MTNTPLNRNGHQLTSLDPITRKGICSLCGDVEVSIAASRPGVTYWRCAFACGRQRISLKGKEHSLTEIDEATATGICKTCGRVKIFKAGKTAKGEQQWRCITAVKKTAAPRKTNKARREHLLSQIDTEARTAVCAKCGPVKIIKRGSQWKGVDMWRCLTAMRIDPKRPAHQRKAQLRSRYGITPDDYDRMLKEQDGKCAICLEPAGERHFSVDHCHAATGKVRSLLCRKCNTGLGSFCDSIPLLQAAIDYIQRHSVQDSSIQSLS
jgi:5-methylcytosine-specific restriction endonuclease McrA